jgi:hypothetical protein
LLRWEEPVEYSRVVNIHQFDHVVNPFGRPPSLCHFDGYPASQRFGGNVESLVPVAFVAMINTSDRSRFSWERTAFMLPECLAGFIKTDN